jgi:hypothetical protein
MRRIQVSCPEFTGTNRLFFWFAWDRKVLMKNVHWQLLAHIPNPQQALNIWKGKQSVIDLNHSETKPKHLLQHGGFSLHTFEVSLHCAISRIVSFKGIYPNLPSFFNARARFATWTFVSCLSLTCEVQICKTSSPMACLAKPRWQGKIFALQFQRLEALTKWFCTDSIRKTHNWLPGKGPAIAQQLPSNGPAMPQSSKLDEQNSVPWRRLMKQNQAEPSRTG